MLLLIYILQQPSDTKMDELLDLIHYSVQFLTRSLIDGADNFVIPILTACQEVLGAIERARRRCETTVASHNTPVHNINKHIEGRSFSNLTNSSGVPMDPCLIPLDEGDDSRRTALYGAPNTQGLNAAPIPNSRMYQGIPGMDEATEFALPFSWSWQDLSTMLLQDLDSMNWVE